MYTSELKHGNVKKIVLDPNGDVHVITPIFPLGKISNHAELFKRWGVTEVAAKAYENLKRAIGKADLTLMKTLDNHFAHPTKEGNDQYENFTYQSHYSLGKLEHVYPNPDSDKVMWGSYKILDPVAKEVAIEYMDSYNKGVVPLYTSSQIVNSASENPYSIEKFDLMHTTLTDEPSFGKELTKVGAVCQGDTQQCVLQIKTASNNTESVGVNIHGKTIDIFHNECPFCVRTELSNLFYQNSLHKINHASNIKMEKQDAEQKEEGSKMIMPDKEQEQKTDSSQLDPTKLAQDISSKVIADFKKSEIHDEAKNVATAEEKKEAPKEEKKVTETAPEASKTIRFEDTDEYKAMAKKIEKLEKIAEKNATDSEELKTLRAEQNYSKIGTLLASYESNFINPENGKADPKSFDKAFDFLRKTGWSVDDIDTVLKIVTPYGSVERSYKAPKQEEQSIIQKASQNRGVPKYDSAFGEEKEEEQVNKASDTKSDEGLSLLDSMLKENEI